jgi:hypothetical protein
MRSGALPQAMSAESRISAHGTNKRLGINAAAGAVNPLEY